MTLQTLYSDYINRVNELISSESHPENRPHEISNLIDEYLANERDNPSYENFLKGEKAFYTGYYELALKHYLKAHDIPDFHFFCYRASAFVSQKMGKYSKAQIFAKKALRLHPDDYLTKKIYLELQDSPAHDDQDMHYADEEKGSDSLDYNYESKQESYLEPLHKELHKPHPTHSILELNELTHIFQDVKPKNDHLFDQDEEKDKITSSLFSATLAKHSTPHHTEETHHQFCDQTKSHSCHKNPESALEERIHSFQQTQKEWVNEYRERAHKHRAVQDDFIQILNGWDSPANRFYHDPQYGNDLPQLLLAQELKKTNGGFFIRWGGKGIVINPGTNFLEKFHQQGLTVFDIDAVIVTRDNLDAYADLQSIYNLNYQLNKGRSDLHIIQYYLNQRAYQNIARFLKPNFKQERNTIHCLDLYLDSPDVEKIHITDEVVLHYFPSSWLKNNKETHHHTDHISASTYGICLELLLTGRRSMYANTAGNSIRIGYISGCPWSPMLSNSIGKCDLLIAGLENTTPTDWTKQKYNADSLGYYGTLTLLEELSPRFLICSEFNGTEGDNRIEITRKLRKDYAEHNKPTHQGPVILPGDTGLYINLTTFKVRCSFSKTFIDPQNIRIVKLRDAFGNLQYLAPQCLI